MLDIPTPQFESGHVFATQTKLISANGPFMSGDKQRILILGGGFAGVYTAMYLERQMFGFERQRYEISLVSLENYMVFQPLLPEVISGTIEMLHVITPIRRLAKRTNLYTREIQGIDLERRVVRWDRSFSRGPKCCRSITSSSRWDRD